MRERTKVSITGIVQGVGFRPFIYRLARESGLTGYVTNTPEGVDLEVQGETESMGRFLAGIRKEAPALAHITGLNRVQIPLKEEDSFIIKKSSAGTPRQTLISPDVYVCEDCLRELRAPEDRRYRYPFINCTNCGPRYTIIKDIPYDRAKTTMASFAMCDACRREYEDPADRRFHAQPIACPDCGPQVFFLDSNGRQIDGPEPIAAAARELARGKIIAIKGLGGFHLAVDATDSRAVLRLRERKRREEKPLAIMASSLDVIRTFAAVGDEEERMLLSPQRPIVIVPKRRDREIIAEQVCPDSPNFGVMLPYTPIHHLLMDHSFTALVMTSGNLSEEPIAIDNDEALHRLGPIADFFLMHNRDIYLRSDDTVARRFAGCMRQIRRSRGYVPVPVFLNRETQPTLALGAELKNTVCLTKGNQAFISQHVGDLENLETFQFFELTIRNLQKILEIQPALLAYDMHPRYLNTGYAVEHKHEFSRSAPVQHHHAHIVSCMAEHGLEGDVIGLAMDGTGYGTDGAVWGGEILRVRPSSFERLGRFGYVPMPGGEKAVKEPARMAVSYLYQAYGDDFFDLDLGVVERMGREKAAMLAEMMRKNVNSPLTSSCGRLFEGVSALLSIRDINAYEGQAAIELEARAAEADVSGHYHWLVERSDGGIYSIRTEPIITGIVDDVKRGVSICHIGARFHETVMACWEELCLAIREETGLDRVVLSGGVFQNALLAEGLPRRLERHGFDVYQHETVPTNDACISLGQAVVVNAMAEAGLIGE